MEKTEYVVIKRIAEDDYGCEERPEGQPLMAMCLVESVDGLNQEWIRVPESVLAENKWDEGSTVKMSFLTKV